MFTELTEIWNCLVSLVSIQIASPLLALFGQPTLAKNSTELAELIVLGLTQVFVIAVVLAPLEMLAPAEKWKDNRIVKVDIVHTLINLLCIVPFGTFLVLGPLEDGIANSLGQSSTEAAWHLGCLLPSLNAHPLILFMVYFVILDFASWAMHRLQHKFAWWWALHSLHHSQRQMGRWTDDRGSVIDSILQAVVLASIGLVIGVPPVEYGFILFMGKIMENISHANTRIGFGPILNKVLVDPRFHRQHHMIADPSSPNLHECNFGFIFSVWDILFRTALYDGKLRPTGIDSADIDADNDLNWWQQQVASYNRMVRALGFGRKQSDLKEIVLVALYPVTVETDITPDKELQEVSGGR